MQKCFSVRLPPPHLWPDRPPAPGRERTQPGPDSARVTGRGVFMEELLAELERRGVPFQVDEVGKKEGLDNDS